MSLAAVYVPDIGNYKDVVVIEVLVAVGDVIKPDQALITVESDKATMDIPAPQGGVVKELRVQLGDKVSEGSLLLVLDTVVTATPQQAALFDAPEPAAVSAPVPAPAPQPVATPSPDQAPGPGHTSPAAPSGPDALSPPAEPLPPLDTEVLVLGGGPGGYTAAFRAADLGKRVVLVERHANLGGVCLNVGCIPSKALLHTAKVLTEAEEMRAHGLGFAPPILDLPRIRAYKDDIVGKLTKGLSGLAKQRKVTVLHGEGRFVDPHTLQVDGPEGRRLVRFEHAIIAVGSSVVKIPGIPWDDPRVMDSTDALTLPDIPERLLVIGGGIIGLEMATVYDALGSKVTVVELGAQLVPGVDPDMVKPLHKRIKARYEAVWLNTRVAKLEARPDGLWATLEGPDAPPPQRFDRALVAVGRSPNGKLIGAEAAGVAVNERGFIAVDRQQRTQVPHIHAIGDVVGQPMLAHKATHEAKVAAEVIAGHKVFFDARTIPGVAYTDPEIAWMGLTETQAKAEGVAYAKALFPWAASGRSLGMGRDEGLTKLLFDPDSQRVLGVTIVGPNAGELIAEAVLALEMGADIHDLALSIHPHPTLSETLAFAAEIANGSITDILPPRRRS